MGLEMEAGRGNGAEKVMVKTKKEVKIIMTVTQYYI